MIERIIEWAVGNKLIVMLVSAALALGGIYAHNFKFQSCVFCHRV